MKFILIYLLIVNACAFLLMLADKRKAQKKLWRIPESTLLTLAILGGSPGVLLGMRLFRHETRKPKFYLGVPLILGLQVLLAGALLLPSIRILWE